MHFALPPKKSSSPPPFARLSAKNGATQKRRKGIQILGYVVLAVLTFYLVASWFRTAPVSNNNDNGAVPADSSIMIVTVFDESEMSEDMITMVKANRDDYAARHGYKTFYTNVSTYAQLTQTSPSSWSLIPALRHAITLNPEIEYIWSLSQHALITNITISLHEHILSPLPDLMLKDIPVVPPDSVIHTSSSVKPSDAYFIVSQDMDNLAHTSFILRNTRTLPTTGPNQQKEGWTQYLLDAWFDPLYRSYAFQKAENHALEHIVQWHPTILAKFVVIDQRRLNSYNYQPPKLTNQETHVTRTKDSMWKPSDLIVNFYGCVDSQQRDCEKEMRKFFKGWLKEVEFFDGKAPDVELKVKDYVPKDRIQTELLDGLSGKRSWDNPRVHI